MNLPNPTHYGLNSATFNFKGVLYSVISKKNKEKPEINEKALPVGLWSIGYQCWMRIPRGWGLIPSMCQIMDADLGQVGYNLKPQPKWWPLPRLATRY